MLKDEKEELEGIIDKERDFQSANISAGAPPDHEVRLPFQTEKSRGLSPELMLMKMRELTEPDALPFDIRYNNCSRTCIDILSAGVADTDPLLKSALNKRALDFLGTPQQVLTNVQNALDIISKDKKENLLSKITSFSPLDRGAGNLLQVFMDPGKGKAAKGLAGFGIMVLGILKIPGTMIRALINPIDTMENIYGGASVVYNKSSSRFLKSLSFISAIPLIILAPFALIENAAKLISQPFRNKRPSVITEHLDDNITTPIPSAHGCSYTSAMSLLISSNVAKNISEKTLEITGSKSPKTILEEFERALEKNPDKIITLDENNFDILNKYIIKKGDKSLTSRFQLCCDESMRRLREIGKITPEAIDALSEEATETVVEEEYNFFSSR